MNYKVTFTELKKYFPATRTIKVLAKNKEHAKSLIAQQFGTCTPFGKPSGKRIVIKAVVAE